MSADTAQFRGWRPHRFGIATDRRTDTHGAMIRIRFRHSWIGATWQVGTPIWWIPRLERLPAAIRIGWLALALSVHWGNA